MDVSTDIIEMQSSEHHIPEQVSFLNSTSSGFGMLAEQSDLAVTPLEIQFTEHNHSSSSLTGERPLGPKSGYPKEIFRKSIKATKIFLDNWGEKTWILDRRRDKLDQDVRSDQIIWMLSGSVPKTSETKELYRQIDNYLDRLGTPQKQKLGLDETISLIELGASHVDNMTGVSQALYQILGSSYLRRFEQKDHVSDVEKAIGCYHTALSFTSPSDSARLTICNNLGNSYLSLFNTMGNLADVDQAIHFHQSAALAPSEGDTQSTFLNNLSLSYTSRFHHSGELTDIDLAIDRFDRLGGLSDIQKAIEYKRQAVFLTHITHADKPIQLSNLGVSYASRFDRLGNLVDINESIDCHKLATSLTPVGHKAMAARLNGLGTAYQRRFAHAGDVEDLEQAIVHLREALRVTPAGDTSRLVWLSNLGSSYTNRFDFLGETSDLENSISSLNEVVSMAPAGHLDLASWLVKLGISLSRRFEHLGDVEDIHRAIGIHHRSVLLTPKDHPKLSARLNNLGNAYHSRFKRMGQVEDIYESVASLVRAVALVPEGDIQMSTILGSLGASYSSRFERSGSLKDIDQAINVQTKAVLHSVEGHFSRAILLGNLGNSYNRRFSRLREYSDIEKAIDCHSQALSLLPDQHSKKPSVLISLGSSYRSRFSERGSIADINHAIEYHSQAVALAPSKHIGIGLFFDQLGHSHKSRYKALGEKEDIEEAIKCHRKAVELVPDEHPRRPASLHSLGGAHYSRFENLNTIEDIDSAILYNAQAVELIPGVNEAKVIILNSLAISHLSRYEQFERLDSLTHSMDYFGAVARSHVGHPYARFFASCVWAKLCLRHQTTTALEAFKRAMELVPQVVWIGDVVGRRYEEVNFIEDIAMEAAAAAIASQEYGLALEWLEAGRSIVWSQFLQLRTPLERLSVADTELADKLKDIAHFLEQSSSLGSTSHPLLLESAFEQLSQQHRRHAEQWEILVAKARSLPGFSDFLCPSRIEHLVDAAQSGPIVIVNIHESRCDALALLPGKNSVIHIPLSMCTQKDIHVARTQLLSSLSCADARSRDDRKPILSYGVSADYFGKIFGTLWTHIARPVLEHMDYLKPRSGEELPHITWCTTGPLGFLPLHAAGYYDQPSSKLSDFAISSYTPSLSALLRPRQPASEFRGILAISQAETVGCEPLPGVVAELAAIKNLVGDLPFTELHGQQATTDTILSKMEEHSWVHLACHAIQNMVEPTKSAFHVHNGTLDLASITRKSIKNAELAFLSACQTATGDEKLSEEAVHLAAGMIMAGYPSVIATIWSIKDQDAPVIAEKVYAHLLEDGVPDARRAAKALHLATAYLRDRVGIKEFARWVPYIHIGL
ncbi:hypothetical protein BDV93DRAFT_611578 [Ceratobasidium sp. AG-I]|nr:hypothetical protein BDV93DRAFT_611578 [Ceratobasidium sp. AG-I]